MTSSSPPTTLPLRLSDPGELVAALPALLGFPPLRSLVLICLEGPRGSTLGLVARLDLPPAEDLATVDAVVEQVAQLCARRATGAAVLVVVEDRCRRGGAPGPGRPHRALVRALRTGMEEVGTELAGAHHVDRVEPGARWSSYGDPRSGVLPDPRCSAVAAAHVVAGRVLRASRAELVDTLARTPSRSVTAALAAAQRDLGRVSKQELLRGVLQVVTRVSPGEPLGLVVAEVAALGAALGVLDVRDACFGLAGAACADDAEALWTALTRMLPAPERSEPATLLAHSAYARGEGPLAGVALEVALESNPEHRMARLLCSCLQAGLEPAAVHELVRTAHHVANRMGVTLPAPTS